MIKITVDKCSELLYVTGILDAGHLNYPKEGIAYLKALGIPTSQNINIHKSDNYINDVGDKLEKLNKRFEGMSGKEIINILKSEQN